MKKLIAVWLVAVIILAGCSTPEGEFDFPSLDEAQQEDGEAPAADSAEDQEEPSDGDGDDDGATGGGEEDTAQQNVDTVSITTSDGRCVITFFGPFEARRGDPFIVEFSVVCDGNPGQGTFFATLGVPPSSANATHANGELNAEGQITLTLEVNWETGKTTLLCSYEGEVYEVTEISILEQG